MSTCAQTITANYNVSGGSQRVKYFLSLGYSTKGRSSRIFSEWSNANFRYDRINYRSNLDFDVTRSTKLSVKVGGVLGIRQAPHGSFGLGALQHDVFGLADDVPGLLPRLDAGYGLRPGLPRRLGRAAGQFEGSFYGNAKTTLSTGDYQQTTSNKLYTDLVFEQKLDFITKGLSLKANVSLSTYYCARLPGGEQRESDVLHRLGRLRLGRGQSVGAVPQSDYVYERIRTPYDGESCRTTTIRPSTGRRRSATTAPSATTP